MGATPASGDLVTVKLLATCGGEPCINDLSFQINDPAATWAEQVQAVADALEAVVGSSASGLWSDGRSTAYNCYGIEVVDVRPATSPLGQIALAWPGVVADDVMPPNDAVCVTLRTAVRGRTGRGRMYLSGYPEGSANGGYWEVAAQDAAQALADALLTAFKVGGSSPSLTWGVVSRYEFGVKRDVPAFTAIESFTVHNEVRTLRRRAIGVRISRRPAA